MLSGQLTQNFGQPLVVGHFVVDVDGQPDVELPLYTVDGCVRLVEVSEVQEQLLRTFLKTRTDHTQLRLINNTVHILNTRTVRLEKTWAILNLTPYNLQ